MKTEHVGDETKLLKVKCMHAGRVMGNKVDPCNFQIGVALPILLLID